MFPAARFAALAALLHSGAIFGFFFAWVCSTMWGLDRLPADVAIAAMQAMNASVRNVVFAPAFFATGPVLALAGALSWRAGSGRAALWFAAAAVAYVGGAMLPTLLVNVPMNEALAQADPADPQAGALWGAYSARWQGWNQLRTVVSGAALLMCGLGLLSLNPGALAVSHASPGRPAPGSPAQPRDRSTAAADSPAGGSATGSA